MNERHNTYLGFLRCYGCSGYKELGLTGINKTRQRRWWRYCPGWLCKQNIFRVNRERDFNKMIPSKFHISCYLTCFLFNGTQSGQQGTAWCEGTNIVLCGLQGTAWCEGTTIALCGQHSGIRTEYGQNQNCSRAAGTVKSLINLM